MNKRQQDAEIAIIEAEIVAVQATLAAYDKLYGTQKVLNPTDAVEQSEISDRWNAAHDREEALKHLIWEIQRSPGQVRYRKLVPEATRDLIAANID
jgi:hypothetical protein